VHGFSKKFKIVSVCRAIALPAFAIFERQIWFLGTLKQAKCRHQPNPRVIQCMSQQITRVWLQLADGICSAPTISASE